MNWWILKRRVHVSWVIAGACLGMLAGVIASQYVPAGLFASGWWLGAGLLLLSLALCRPRLGLLLLTLIGGMVVGLWRGSVNQQTLTPYAKSINHQVIVSGFVSEDVDIAKDGSLVMRLERVSINGHALPGKIWVSLSAKGDIKRSDSVTVEGKLGQGFGNFSATMYRARLQKVQRPQPGDVALAVRDWFSEAIRKAIPEPGASLGIGYLVGQRRSLPSSLDEALKTAGLTHIVVASGYNLTILVRLARRFFEKISRYLSVFFAGGMIVAFIAVTGLSPSMSRAGLVAALSLLAWYYGRAFHPLVLLPFTAAITVLVNPDYTRGDLGWELSFASFAGVMILAPLLQAYFFGDKKPGTVRQILGETIAAHILTLPLLILAFGQFSNVAIVSNLLVLPLVPLAMLLTFIAGVGSLLFPAGASVLGMPATWVLQYMTNVAEYLAGLPWAVSRLNMNIFWCVMMYGLVAAAILYMWRKTRFNLRKANIVE